MIIAFSRLHFSRLIPKVITYRNYKKSHEEKILNDLKETNIRLDEKDPTKTFNKVFNKNIFNLCNQTYSFKKRELFEKIRLPI